MSELLESLFFINCIFEKVCSCNNILTIELYKIIRFINIAGTLPFVSKVIRNVSIKQHVASSLLSEKQSIIQAETEQVYVLV